MFLKEYPVVLSTTYSAKSCISKEMVLIMSLWMKPHKWT